MRREVRTTSVSDLVSHLHYVIQVLVLADLDRCRPLGVERFERGQIGAALIHGNRFGLTILVNRLLEVAARSGLVTMGAHKKSTVLPCLSTARYRYFH